LVSLQLEQHCEINLFLSIKSDYSAATKNKAKTKRKNYLDENVKDK